MPPLKKPGGSPRPLRKSHTSRPVIGWREWLSIPDLGIERIKVKVDTGARSSSLHAYDLKRFKRRGVSMVRFKVHPLQRDSRTTVEAAVPVVDLRTVRSSSGAATLRLVVAVEAVLGEHRWPIELTLTRRDEMGFRMLLGRQAVRGRFVVDPGASFLSGR